MSGAVDFIVGGIAIGASFLVASVGLGFLAAPLFAYGTGRIIGGISKLRNSAEQRIEGTKLNVRTTQSSIPVVYGKSRVGLRVMDMRIIDSNDAATPSANPDDIFTGSDDDDILVKVGALALGSNDGSGIQAVDNIRMYSDGVDAIVSPGGFSAAPATTGIISRYSSHLKYVLEDGDDAQGAAVIDLSNSLGWAANKKGGGVAYGAFFMLFDTDVWTGGVPQITAEITGNRVYDPRSSTWINFAASGPSADNPALCILDYVTANRYGGGVPYAARDGGSDDFIHEQSFIDAANYCDDLVSIPPSGTEKRFRMDAAVDTSIVVGSNLADMLATCRGELVWQNGLYRLNINQVTTAETFELTENNIVGAIEWVRKGASVPNVMEATYPDNLNGDYSANSVTWPLVGDTTLLDEDNGVENRAEVSLPFTTRFLQAQRTVMVMLREARNDVLVNLTATEEAYELEVGNVVKVTHEGPGWVQLEFTVRQVALTPDGLVRLAMQQYTAAAYTLDSLTAQPSAPTTNLPDPSSIAVPTGVTLLSDATTTLLTQDGAAVPRIRIKWTAPVDPFLSHFDVRFRKTADADFEAAPDPKKTDDTLFIWPVSDGVGYTVEIRSVNTLGAVSAFVSNVVTVVTAGQPDFTLRAFLDQSLSGIAELDGNFATKSARIAFVKGFTPLTEPTEAAVRARGFIDGTKFSNVQISAGYSDIPVPIEKGEAVLFKAFTYSEVSAGGEESDLPVTALVTRPITLAFLNLAGGNYTISTDPLDANASFVFDVSDGAIRIQDTFEDGSAIGNEDGDFTIVNAPEVP